MIPILDPPSTSRRLLPPLFCFLTLLSGCGSREPFSYVQGSGKVIYEDGSLIPADPLVLMFIYQGSTIDGKTHPRPGMATVDLATGKFSSVTSHTIGDGLVPGKYKVMLTGLNCTPISPSLVPPEYSDSKQTPLEIDTANSPFELKVRKPPASAANAGR